MKDFSLERLKQEIFSKKSFLCVGLDVDLNKIPPFLLKESDPIFAFNKTIIDATHPYTISLISLSMRPMGKKVGSH